jgi:hypothetical protein
MINYTTSITNLMQDVVSRVPALGFIDMDELMVFARHGRSEAEGAFATCHCLTLPTSEPGYYFWRDRRTGQLTRRSEWFVTKSPEVRFGRRRLKYLISFVLPRFCDQSLVRSRKKDHYPGMEPWIAKLDTIIHELYHIDPAETGIRKIEKTDGTYSPRSHGPGFYEQVAEMVRTYLQSDPNPFVYDFLRFDYRSLIERFGGVAGATFKNYPSFPQRYIEPLGSQPRGRGIRVEPLKPTTQPAVYTEDDLHLHQFFKTSARRLTSNGQGRAA